MKKTTISVLLLGFMGNAAGAKDFEPIWVDSNNHAGFVRHVFLTLYDQVEDRCWTNVSSVESRIRLMLEREGISVLENEPQFFTPATQQVSFSVFGYRTENGICAVSAGMEVGRNLFSEYGSEQAGAEFIFYTWSEIESKRSLFTSGTDNNLQIMNFAESSLSDFLADYYSGKRSEHVKDFFRAFPSAAEQPMSKEEFENILREAGSDTN